MIPVIPVINWPIDTTVEEVVYQAIHAEDWRQTLAIADNPAKYRESTSAWLIGAHPSRADVNAYMAGEATLHLGATALLVRAGAPDWIRTTWEGVSIVYNGHAVVANYRLGL
jgi:hypothetical protein